MSIAHHHTTLLPQRHAEHLLALRAMLTDLSHDDPALMALCAVVLARIDATLAGTALPSVGLQVADILPRLTVLCATLSAATDPVLRAGVIQCQRAMERTLGQRPAQPSRRERWEVEGPQRASTPEQTALDTTLDALSQHVMDQVVRARLRVAEHHGVSFWETTADIARADDGHLVVTGRVARPI
jgi:hypothetical protein